MKSQAGVPSSERCVDPRFSVVIATYNQQNYVREAVRSVLDQTVSAHEVIVVADGCTDSTVDVLREEYPDVKVIEQPNLGKCVARNTGALAATGNWVCFLDHDDLWDRTKLAYVRDYLAENPSCCALCHPVWLFSAPGGPATGFALQRDFVAADLAECHRMAACLVGNSVNEISLVDTKGKSFECALGRRFGTTSTLVVARDVFWRAGGFCPMQFNGEDWTLYVNVARIAGWHFIDKRLGFMRLHRESGTYAATAGLNLLACEVNAWFAGRPLRDAEGLLYCLGILARFGNCYRLEAQSCFWDALLHGRLGVARLIYHAFQMLLPRWRDRAYAMLPPQITWRWERYILGMHK